MALPLVHRRRPSSRPDAGSARPPHLAPEPGSNSSALPDFSGGTAITARVPAVHRVGAVAVAAILLVFGILGFVGGLDYFSTDGERILGLSSNGLLSTLSVTTAAVLIAAAVRGSEFASAVMMVVGSLFLVSALANLAVLGTSFNFLGFEFSNVIFSIGVGLVLLVLGAYGRVGGHLPPDSPYSHSDPDADGRNPAEDNASTPAELAAERAMRQAEIAVVQHVATADQRRRVAAMAPVHTRLERRQVWMGLDAGPGSALQPGGFMAE